MKRTNPPARIAASLFAAAVAAAVFAWALPATAQRTGGSFGGRSWGSVAPARRPPPAAPATALRQPQRIAPPRGTIFSVRPIARPSPPATAFRPTWRRQAPPSIVDPAVRRLRPASGRTGAVVARAPATAVVAPSGGGEPRYETISCGVSHGAPGGWPLAALLAAWTFALRGRKESGRGA